MNVSIDFGTFFNQDDYYALKSKLAFYRKRMLPAFEREVFTPLLKDVKKELIGGILSGKSLADDNDYFVKNKGKYGKWKKAEHGGNPPLVLEGDYIGNIAVMGKKRGTQFIGRGLGFRNGAYMALGRFLESGGNPKSYGVSIPSKYPGKPVTNAASRPHWGPAWDYAYRTFPRYLNSFSQKHMKRRR